MDELSIPTSERPNHTPEEQREYLSQAGQRALRLAIAFNLASKQGTTDSSLLEVADEFLTFSADERVAPFTRENEPNNVPDTNIDNWGLSTRAYNIAHRYGLTTIDDIPTASREELARLYGAGPQVIAEIERAIERFGLSLPD